MSDEEMDMALSNEALKARWDNSPREKAEKYDALVADLRKLADLWESKGRELIKNIDCYESRLLAATWEDRARDIRNLLNREEQNEPHHGTRISRHERR